MKNPADNGVLSDLLKSKIIKKISEIWQQEAKCDSDLKHIKKSLDECIKSDIHLCALKKTTILPIN